MGLQGDVRRVTATLECLHGVLFVDAPKRVLYTPKWVLDTPERVVRHTHAFR